MINSKEFTERLEKIIDFYGESASSFAEKIGVQRSSISHILSGRNKPSLDFVLKVLSAYPEVELYWLLNGKGIFPNQTASFENQSNTSETKTRDAFETQIPNDKDIERIVIFFKDGTFKNFHNQ
ncbi:transcriptional regulator [Hanstruepera neustonica]|uniref:Transcriptional regulator n=1 Tax=Hanstruepera neustonica TaxID=1445657 RepID=A0A2K1DYB7_9FLAO|nr:helix-turn-helix transcriptional regulator [Hanstruepera neustonica]PNQ73012.1 transcriptional regulator [Hanstruepera neustonica]